MLISCPRGKCSEFPAVSLLVDSLKWNLLFGINRQIKRLVCSRSFHWFGTTTWKFENSSQNGSFHAIGSFRTRNVRIMHAEMKQECQRKSGKALEDVLQCRGLNDGHGLLQILSQSSGSSLSQRATSSWYTLKSGGTLPDQFSTVAPNCKAQTYNRNNNQPSNYKYDQIRHGKARHALTIKTHLIF